MPTRINISQRIVAAVSVEIQTKRIRPSACEWVTADKSTCTRIVISCPKINSSYFSIVIFTAVTKRIGIVLVNILLNTKSVVSVLFGYLALSVCKINNIAVSVLSVVGIFWFCTITEVILCYKICASDIAIYFSFISTSFIKFSISNLLKIKGLK